MSHTKKTLFASILLIISAIILFRYFTQDIKQEIEHQIIEKKALSSIFSFLVRFLQKTEASASRG